MSYLLKYFLFYYFNIDTHYLEIHYKVYHNLSNVLSSRLISLFGKSHATGRWWCSTVGGWSSLGRVATAAASLLPLSSFSTLSFQPQVTVLVVEVRGLAFIVSTLVTASSPLWSWLHLTAGSKVVTTVARLNFTGQMIHLELMELFGNTQYDIWNKKY